MRHEVSEGLRRHQRIAILRALFDCKDWRANDSFLTTMLDDLALSAEREEVVQELGWLKRQGMIETSQVADLIVAQLTEKGMQVAIGQKTHAGILKPRKKG
jgi:hypothetical protein